MAIYGKGKDQEESFKQQHGGIPLVALGLHKGVKKKEKLQALIDNCYFIVALASLHKDKGKLKKKKKPIRPKPLSGQDIMTKSYLHCIM